MKIKTTPIFAALMATTLVAGPMMLTVSPAVAATSSEQDEGYQRRLVLANRLIELVGTKTMLDTMIGNMSGLMTQAIKGDPNISKLPKADQDKLTELLLEEFQATLATDLISAYASEYAEEFSESELTQLVTIYDSPLMQKTAAFNLTLQEKLKAKGEKLGQAAAERAVMRWLKWRQQQRK